MYFYASFHHHKRIFMNFLSISHFITLRFNYFENYVVNHLTLQQKRISAIALVIFSALASCFLIYRYCFRAKGLERSEQISNLILNLDVNRTIIADDPNAGFQLSDILAMLLAENYKGKWNGEEQTFLDYVCSLIPGSHNGPIKKQRQAILKDFVHLLKNLSFQDESTINFSKLKNPPLEDIGDVKQKIKQVKIQVLADLKKFKQIDAEGFERLKEKIMHDYARMETKLLQQPHFIFPSFFRLVAWLKEKKEVNFHIILRTFGNDASRIAVELEKVFSEEKFSHAGKYLDGKWHIVSAASGENQVLEKVTEVYQFFKSHKYIHLALQDDWKEWNINQEHQDHGKRFLLKLNSKHTHSLMIDDNIEVESESEKNIVTPIDVDTGKFIPINPLIEKKIAVRTKTMEAILDDEYFIKVVEESLNLNGKMMA